MKSGCRLGDGSRRTGFKSSGEAVRYLLVRPGSGPGCLREAALQSQTAAGEMSLSAAVSACCTVWKSSVMAYLMVIVQGGERLPCLHAGICRRFRVEASAGAVEGQDGRR